MLRAVLSDVHAHAAALETALADARRAGAEEVICLGDIVGYGSDPAACVKRVRETCAVVLAGNHDDAVSCRMGTEDFIDRAAVAAVGQAQALSVEDREWLGTLPYVYADPSGAFACAHGDFARPESFDYVSHPDDAFPSWKVRSEPLLFVGHTHVAGVHVLGPDGAAHRLVPVDFTLEPGRRYIVNPGTVGYPRDGSGRGSYVLYDDVAGTIRFRTFPLEGGTSRKPRRAWLRSLFLFLVLPLAAAGFFLWRTSAPALPHRVLELRPGDTHVYCAAVLGKGTAGSVDFELSFSDADGHRTGGETWTLKRSTTKDFKVPAGSARALLVWQEHLDGKGEGMKPVVFARGKLPPKTRKDR